MKTKSALLSLVLAGLFLSPALMAEDRKPKQQTKPVYPELARKMRISGKVRVEVTIAPDGSVKGSRVIGGHPVLAQAAMETVKGWRYEAGSEETTQIVEFVFDLTS